MEIRNSKIVTFYSYKGGVGRSMSLANVAWLLANEYNKTVLIIDWDLEAPGLHRFFNINENEIKKGLIDLFYDYKEILRSDISSIKEDIIDIDNYIKIISNKSNTKGSISILPAGKQDAEYAGRVNNFDWHEFYKKWHGFGFIEYLKEELKKRADFILIDSRTGVTDIGGICTLQMPDIVVLLFSLNEQCISGTDSIIKNILNESIKFRENESAPKLIIVPSRVEIYLEQETLKIWQKKVADLFENYLPNNRRNEDAVQYMINNSIPYLGYYSFGENIAVTKHPIDPLGKSFFNLTLMIYESAGYSLNSKVFISYSHDSQEHMDRVLALSDRLRADGIDCSIDQYETSPPEGWARWCNNQIEEADFVLVLCTGIYEARFKGIDTTGKGKGAKWEGAIITQELFDAQARNEKFIPVIFTPDDGIYIPTILRGATNYNPNTENGYESLYRQLTNQTFTVKPVLDKLKSLPPRPRKKGFHAPPWNVPIQRNPYFTGREDVLEKLHNSLNSDKAAALVQVISGLGGIGKTQTAVEYAYRYGSEYEAVLWIEADSHDALISGFVGIAQLLSLPEKDAKDQNLVVTAAMRWLVENQGWLLILDNADDTALLEEYIPINPKGHILLTSRATLFGNLGISNPIELGKMMLDEAKDFVLKRTRRGLQSLSELEALSKIAEDLGYLPLALELAGAYINKAKCSFADYLSSYRGRGLTQLQLFPPVVEKYPKSVANSWLLNFEQVEKISKASADLLRASAFLNPDNIPLELITNGAKELGDAISTALTDIENDPLIIDELLLPLTQYSLIVRNASERTYSIHCLVQSLIRDRMDDNTKRLWGERTVRAVNSAFPSVEFQNWHLCSRMLPHAEVSAALIEEWGFEFQEAGRLLNQAGFYLVDQARYGEAELMYRRALSMREKTLGTDHPDVANSLNNLAQLYDSEGKYDEAEPLYRRALAIREQSLGSDHPSVAQSLNNLALLCQSQGKYDEAEPLYRRALEIYEKSLGSDHPSVAQSLNNLAELYRAQGKFADAEPMQRRALEIRENSLSSDNPDVANSLNNLAELYRVQGKYADAEPMYRHALAIREKSLGKDHPDVANSLNNLALLYQSQGKYAIAMSLYRQALEILEKSYGKNHPNIATVLENLTALLLKTNRMREAKMMEERTKVIRGGGRGIKRF